MKLTPSFSESLLNSRWLLPGAIAIALVMGWLVGLAGVVIPSLLIGLTLLIFLVVLVFNQPRVGFIIYIIYCFLLSYLGHHVNAISFGLGMDGLLVMTWLAVIFHRSEQQNLGRIQNELSLLALIWFVINVLEIANPARPSLAGWFYEMRSTTLYWLLTVPLGFVVFHTRRDLRLFLLLIITFSLLGSLYGIKQKVLGVDTMEQQWLDAGAAATHLIWGKLRVFSFYSEAAQFGASQAHISLICFILALGPFAWWKRLLFGLASFFLLYGMLISGTRGAMFVLVAGLFVYLFLSKQVKVLILGCLLAAGSYGVLKYTNIGNGNPDIFRLRTSLDPNDPSFRLRLSNQATLRTYLANKPFGEGVGTIGAWGHEFNADKFVSTIEPDSYYVKIWAEYGIIGFLIWFGMMLFILGKCCGIVWQIRDPKLRQQLLALTAGYSGILLASYGNEIMNQVPSAMILYISWVFIFQGPELDTVPTTHLIKS
jgi:O-antigen ligase